MSRYFRSLLIAIMAWAFITRFYNLYLPQHYIFDEVYHAITAKLIARNDPRAYEWWNPPVEKDTAVDWLHPPLAKYTQAASMLLLGENTFGWRFSSAIVGVLVVGLTAQLAKTLFDREDVALLAAALASFDGLLLVQSRIAMNDIHVTALILLTLIVYLRYLKKPTLKLLAITGLCAGLAMGTKWSGLFVLMTVWAVELLRQGWLWLKVLQEKTLTYQEVGHFMAVRIILLGALPFAVYFLSYAHMFLQGKPITHFVELHQQIFGYQLHLTATHGYQSRPWQWFLNLKPVWFAVEYVDEEHIGNIYNLGNPLLFWLGAVAVLITMGSLAHTVMRRKATKIEKTFTKDAPRLAFLLLAYLMVWLPWQISPRIMFFYHYTPAVPLLSIILSYWLIKLATPTKTRKSVSTEEIYGPRAISVAIVVAIAVTFVLFYPHWTGMAMPKWWVNYVYYAVPSWK